MANNLENLKFTRIVGETGGDFIAHLIATAKPCSWPCSAVDGSKAVQRCKPRLRATLGVGRHQG